MSVPMSSKTSPSRIHYAWIVVAVTFATSVVTAGTLGISGILLLPLQQEFGWNVSDMSSAFGVRLALFGLLGPFTATLMNRFGVRRMVTIALSILAGLVGTLFTTTVWEFFLFWGLLTGVGIGLTALVLSATVATRWFVQRRGLVTGLLSASNATGQLIFLPALASVTQAYGWRTTIIIACAANVFSVILVLLFMRNHPKDVGVTAYGETMPQAQVSLAEHHRSIWSLFSIPVSVLKEAVKVPVFWVLFFTFFICGASTNGLIQTHFVPLCGDFGIVPVEAAGILALMGLFDLFGTIGSGWLSDRFDNRLLLFWYYGLRGLSLMYLPFSDFTFYGLSLFALFYGLDWIATVPPTVKLTADRFGPEKAGMVFGWVFAGHQIGAASAAFGAGLVRTEYSTYLPAFFIAGALCVIAAALVLTVRKPSARGIGKAAPARA